MPIEITGKVAAILAGKCTEIWTIRPQATVFEAIAMMSEKNVGALPVLDAGKLVGMISERDYTRKVILAGRSSKDTTVKEIMATNVATAIPQDSISECMRRITANRVRHLPVFEGETMVGILSSGDLLNWMLSAQSATLEQMERYMSGGEYPA